MEEDAQHQYLYICAHTCPHGISETSAGTDGSLGSPYIVIRWRLLWDAVIFISFKYCTNSSRTAYNEFWQDLSHAPPSKSSEIQSSQLGQPLWNSVWRFLTITSKRPRTAACSSCITFQYIPEESKSAYSEGAYKPMFIWGLLRTANSWNQPNHPAVEG